MLLKPHIILSASRWFRFLWFDSVWFGPSQKLSFCSSVRVHTTFSHAGRGNFASQDLKQLKMHPSGQF